MKIKQWLSAAIAVLSIFSTPPSYALSMEQSTEVECHVEPVYAFSVPARAVIRYPQTQALPGTLDVIDLFIDCDEWLTIEVTPSPLEAKGPSTPDLPYTVTVDAPAMLDRSNTGDQYSVVISIDADAFDAAEAKKYDGLIVFQAISYPADEIVWDGAMRLTVHKTAKPYEMPARTGEDIPQEDVPASATSGTGIAWWIVVIIAGMPALAFFILFLIISKRRKRSARS